MALTNKKSNLVGEKCNFVCLTEVMTLFVVARLKE